jgi:hypothetical protein
MTTEQMDTSKDATATADREDRQGSNEDLRVALQRYRSFFDRLLSV